MTAPSSSAHAASAGIAVIMAGGRGTRFWPLSRTERPKQLLALTPGGSLLRQTYERIAPLVGPDRVLVVTSGELGEDIRRELPEIPAAHVVAEPIGRNTAPCAVLGLGLARRLDPAAPVVLLPADHHIPTIDAFRRQLAAAFDHVRERQTVATFGIRPTRPETGYGYLEVAPHEADATVLKGLAFVEKPAPARARDYQRSGRHFWNSGIFVWNPAWFDTMIDRHLPAVRDLLAESVASFGTDGFVPALETAYDACPAQSIDYAVMERLVEFAVIPARFDWSDLGGWNAWGELAAALPGPNRGQADIMALDSRDNVLYVEKRLLALIGVEDLIVVDRPDALLVCRRDQADRLREIIARLEEEGRSELL